MQTMKYIGKIEIMDTLGVTDGTVMLGQALPEATRWPMITTETLTRRYLQGRYLLAPT